MTWVTNISPVFQLGLEPIFCDINSQNFSFDSDYLQKLKNKHPDIKLIWITHLFGLASKCKRSKKLMARCTNSRRCV